MAEENRRPQGREKYVTNESKGVHKRGDGLGTGPVGGGQSNPTGGQSSGAQRGSTARAGGGRTSLIGIIVAAVVLLGGGGGALSSMLGGGGDTDVSDYGSAVLQTPAPTVSSSTDSATGGAGALLSSILGSGIPSGALETVTASSSVSG